MATVTIFWDEPKVTILAMPRLMAAPDSMWQTNDTKPVTSCEAMPELGGRVCYMSFGNGRTSNKEYLKNILDKGHESVLEHATVSFGIEGISRSCSHELVRHRHLSFSQLSQRYVKEVAFVVPPNLPPERRGLFEDYCFRAKQHYQEFLEVTKDMGKDSKALARSVLPNCTETKMVVTGNLRAWRHFVKLRGTEHAEVEIRRLALVLFGRLEILASNVFQDLEIVNGTVRTIPT